MKGFIKERRFEEKYFAALFFAAPSLLACVQTSLFSSSFATSLRKSTNAVCVTNEIFGVKRKQGGGYREGTFCAF